MASNRVREWPKVKLHQWGGKKDHMEVCKPVYLDFMMKAIETY